MTGFVTSKFERLAASIAGVTLIVKVCSNVVFHVASGAALDVANFAAQLLPAFTIAH